MNWTDIIVPVVTSGGILYLIVDKLIMSKKERADVAQQSKKNQQLDIDTGLNAINFYKQINDLIKAQTDPLNAKIDKLTDRLDKFGCYRECEMRIRNEQDANE